MKKRVCVCACVRVRVCVYVCVCVHTSFGCETLKERDCLNNLCFGGWGVSKMDLKEIGWELPCSCSGQCNLFYLKLSSL